MSSAKLTKVIDKIGEENNRTILFKSIRRISTTEYFETIAPKFKSKLTRIVRENGKFEFDLYCVWRYGDETRRKREAIGAVSHIGKYSIYNNGSINNCYQSMIKDIKEEWNKCKIQSDSIERVHLSISILQNKNNP